MSLDMERLWREHYKKIYRRVIQEAKRMENNYYINRAKNKPKAAWQAINKELGETSVNDKNMEITWGKIK
jgi:predicted ATP-binding protein involved in virulence